MKLKYTTRTTLLDAFIRDELTKLNGAVIAKSPTDFFTIRAAVLPRWQFEADVRTMDMVLDPEQFRIAWLRVLRLPGGGAFKSFGPPRPPTDGLPMRLKPKIPTGQGVALLPMPVPAPKPADDQPPGGMEL